MAHKAGVLASGEGTNFERLCVVCNNGEIRDLEVACLLTDRLCGAEARAKRLGVACRCFDPKSFADPQAFSTAMTDELIAQGVSVVILAGYLRKITVPMLERYAGRILNVHPALLPKFGGKGMYGRAVHEAVLRAGEKETGITVHVVDAVYDHGPVVLQQKIAIKEAESVESLQRRVHELEYEYYPKAVAHFIKTL